MGKPTNNQTDTASSFDGETSQSVDGRRNDRFVSVFRVGKLSVGGQEQLCLIRNISANGLMAQIYSPRTVGDVISIELKTGTVVTGKVVWMEDAKAGIEFDEEIDVLQLLAGALQESVPGWVSRQPRLTIPIAARLRRGVTVFQTDICDISQGGVKVVSSEKLKPEDQVMIAIDGLGPFEGMVRWCHGQYAGISFNQPIPLRALANWAIQIDDDPSEPDMT